MFFYLSKILWEFIDPVNLLLFGVCFGFALTFSKRFARLGRRLLGVSIGVGFVLSVFPFGLVLNSKLENRFPLPTELPAKVDGIIVLGGVINTKRTVDRQQLSLGGAVVRLTEFTTLAKQYPEAKLVFTGGSGDMFNQARKEAHFVGPFLERLGLDPQRVIYEDQSRNTWENATLSKKLANPQPGENWILISSAFHLPRAMGSFRKAGWNPIAYPAGFQTPTNPMFSFNFNFLGNIGTLSGAVHEYVGILVYWLTGKSSELFPGPN